MAQETHRAQLEIYDVLGMCARAVLSFRSSIPLLLTLALVSSIYETAVERSSLLSGISFSAQNSNFSFQFSFDPKPPAKTPQGDLKNNRPEPLPEGESWFSRLLASFLPQEHKAAEIREHHPGEVESEPSGLAVDEREHLDGGIIETDRSGLAVDNTEVSDTESKTTSAAGISEGVIEKDEVLQTKDRNYESEEVGGTSKEVELASSEVEESQLEEPPLHVDSEDGSTEKWAQSTEEENGRSALQKVSANEEADNDDHSLPRLVIETVSNETKRPIPDFMVDTMDLAFFTGRLLGGRGLDQGAMPHGGMTMLLMFFFVAIAMAIFLAVVGFQHAAVMGSVAYSVVTTHMGKRAPFRKAIKSGFKAGVTRLMWLAILHATFRGLQSLFFMKTLFGGVMEMDQVEQLVVRLAATPFAFLAPFMDVDATSVSMALRIGLFVGFDYIFDGIAYCLYVVACWVTIMEREYWGLRAFSRSWNLVKCMDTQALVIRLLEAVVCGTTCRWLLQQAIGQFLAAFVISTAQVYFLVLWLIFYLSARSKLDGSSHFSYRTLEDFLDRFK